MTQPDPNTSPPDPRSSLRALIEAFTKLPPLLSYGGLILMAGIVILSMTGVLPEALLWIPAVAIAAFLVYAYMQFGEEKAKRQFELDKQAQELKHQQEMARLTKQPDLMPEEQTPPPPPPDDPAWQSGYLRHETSCRVGAMQPGKTCAMQNPFITGCLARNAIVFY